MRILRRLLFAIAAYMLLSHQAAISSPDTKETCLSNVCIGHVLSDLVDVQWISADEVAATSHLKITRYPKLDSLWRGKSKRLRSNNSQISGELRDTITGIDENDLRKVARYVEAGFIDNDAITILAKATICRGIAFEGFRKSKSGYIDVVTMVPIGNRLEVVGIQRDYSKLDKPTWNGVVKGLSKNYPSMIDYRTFMRYGRKGKYVGKVVIYTTPSYNQLIIVNQMEKSIRDPRHFTSKGQLIKATNELVNQPACDSTTTAPVN